MSHNIYLNKDSGKHSFMSVQKTAWHGLGQIIQDYPTSAEAIAHAGLDYTVEKRPLFCYEPAKYAQEVLQVPDHYATVRADSKAILGVVGNDYEIIQNKDAFTFFDSIVGGEGIQYETAGALGKGERIFITAKLPDYIKVGNDDLIGKYLFLTTSHDGFGSITAAFTPVRIVCANTLAAALGSKSHAIKIRHTANAKDRLEQAHKVMGISNRLSQDMEGMFNRWAKVRITDPEVRKLIQLAMIPNKEVRQNLLSGKEDELSTHFRNICENVYEYGMSNPTQQQETTKGTLFGAYNAVTGYFQNVRKYKDGESKLKSILFGGNAQIRTQVAFNLCDAFAKKGGDALILN